MAFKFKTTAARSRVMSKIRSLETTPEVVLRKALWGKGIRYRKNYKKLPGSPDIAVVKHKVAVFVDGEFWHGYQWKRKKKKLKANRRYWVPKIEKNILRDRKYNREIKKRGWKVIRFWQHQIYKDTHKCIQAIKKLAKKSSR